MTSDFTVSAALVFNQKGETLFVRKHNTKMFMQVGGKPEPDETPLDTLIRETNEELGLNVLPENIHSIGTFNAPAANEVGLTIKAHCFWFQIFSPITAKAEIAEILWCNPLDSVPINIAPLYRDHLEKITRQITLSLLSQNQTAETR